VLQLDPFIEFLPLMSQLRMKSKMDILGVLENLFSSGGHAGDGTSAPATMSR
jgi:hypothetical protein